MKFARKILAASALSMAFALSAPAHADVKAGVDAWERGDFAAAVTEWRQPALDGDADAQFNLGQAYKLGRGVPMDLRVAEDWFKRAADQGHLQAADNYGLILFQSNRRAEAMPYIEASAARGEPRAQYVLGTAHFNGDLVNKDWPRAYALMTRASASGLPQASQSLAQMDQYIPLGERQQGLTLAAQLERDADRIRNQQYAGLTSPMPTAPVQVPAQRPAPNPVQTAQLPPSAVSQPAPRPAPAQSTGTYVPSVTAPDTSVAATAGADFARPAAAPAPGQRPAPVARTGDWRIQLGAFSDQSKAESLWNTLEARNNSLAGLQPYLVKAGNITRLQAGPFSSKSEAASACATLGGQACFAVKKN